MTDNASDGDSFDDVCADNMSMAIQEFETVYPPGSFWTEKFTITITGVTGASVPTGCVWHLEEDGNPWITTSGTELTASRALTMAKEYVDSIISNRNRR